MNYIVRVYFYLFLNNTYQAIRSFTRNMSRMFSTEFSKLEAKLTNYILGTILTIEIKLNGLN